MNDLENIAIVNIEWSDDYAGSNLSGYYGGGGNEKYLFKAFQGRFFAYVPPNGKSFPKKDPDRNWLIFFASRPSENDPLVVVGWLESAKFTGHLDRPDAFELGLNLEGDPFTYSISAERAVTIPAASRDCILPKGPGFRAYCYIRCDGVDKENRKRLVRELLAYRDTIAVVGNEKRPALPKNFSGGFCFDAQRRKEIEDAAVKAVKKHYGKRFTFKDRQTDGCGYDLEFIDKLTREKWCVEVKGTATGRQVFFISPNERATGERMARAEAAGGKNDGCWRLALVTCATDRQRRGITFYRSEEIESGFQFAPTQWQVTPNKPEGAR